MEDQQITPKKERDYVLPASILIAVVIIAVSFIYSTGVKNSPAGQLPDSTGVQLNEDGSVEVEVGDDVILGNPDAPVTFIEFGDYQCPFCARLFLDTGLKLRSEYVETGKVRVIYKDFAFLGRESTDAAQAAECAKDQNSFWLYHDALFEIEIADGLENNGNLSIDKLKSLAVELGLDRVKFDSCFDSEKYKDEVLNDYSEAQAAGVRATPTVFINGKKFEGALPYSTFKEEIDRILNE